MSLLNAALRKREKENRQHEVSALFKEKDNTAGKSKLRIYGIFVCLMLGLGLAFLYLLEAPEQEKPNPPVSMLSGNRAIGRAAGQTDSASVEIIASEPEKAETKEKNIPVATAVERPGNAGRTALKQKKPAYDENAAKKDQAGRSGNRTTGNVQSEPKTLKPSGQEPADPFYEKAVYYHRQNRLKEAIAMYLQVLDKNPLNNDALFNLAAAYLKNREFALALPVLQRLSGTDPDNPQIMVNHAIARMGMGEPAVAVSILDAALQTDGAPLFDIYFHKAAALSQLGRLDESKLFYEKAGKIYPEDCRLKFNLAVLYDKMEAYVEALRHYRAFMECQEWSSDQEKKSVNDRMIFLTVFIERQRNTIQHPNKAKSNADDAK